jgi:hypothetical protein
MKYTYLVAYTFIDSAGYFCFGNTSIVTHGPVKSLDDIRRMEAHVSDQNGGGKVVLLSFQLLNKEK